MAFPVPGRLRAVAAAGLLALIAAACLAAACRLSPLVLGLVVPSGHRPRLPPPTLPRPSAAQHPIETRPLAPGTELPPLPAGAEPARAAGEVVVVDVWAGWCPFCRAEAPGLLRTYERYEDRGVRFVSLTPDPGPEAEQFVQEFGLPWPCVYSAPAETLAALGALNRFGDHCEVAPTLYVVGRDGRVAWSDQGARYRHEDPATAVRQLQRAIDEALRAAP